VRWLTGGVSGFLACIGGTVGSCIAVWLGGLLGMGILGLYVVSVVGTAVGVFYGRRAAASMLG
jgi:hypothetical protein